MCHNDCRPGYGGVCIDCGEEVTAEEPTTPAVPPRFCIKCGEEEGSTWAGKHCTYEPQLIAGPDVKVSAGAALQQELRATRTAVTE